MKIWTKLGLLAIVGLSLTACGEMLKIKVRLLVHQKRLMLKQAPAKL